MKFSLASIFGNGAPPAAPAQPVQPSDAPTPQVQPPAHGDKVTQSMDPNVPAMDKSNTDDPKPQSPLDQFVDLFQTNPDDNKAADSNEPERLFNVDPNKILETAQRMKFVEANEQVQQLAQQAISGDANALMTLLNIAASNAYAHSVTLGAELTEKAHRASTEKFRSSFGAEFRNHAADSELRNRNQHFTHPSMQPLVGALKQQAAMKYPNASPAEIAETVDRYLTSVAAVLAGNNGQAAPTASGNSQRDQEFNWGEFFGV